MTHWQIAPLLIPLFTGALLLAGYRTSAYKKRVLSLLATFALVPVGIYLVLLADDGELRYYLLGNWPTPFGIRLLLDRLSAIMVLLTAVLASAALFYSSRDEEHHAPNFHGLFQFQLLGINGAFLTADLFNLFVFFEILLIASYALLVFGNQREKIRTAQHYVILNLLGSSLFLLGLGILYGLLGTLDMRELALRIASTAPDDQPLLRAAGVCLLIVFALKAAVLPLSFWLPKTYAAADAGVAALFAIMTKVGLYAILRVFSLLFAHESAGFSAFLDQLLWVMALLTLAFAGIGALAAKQLSLLLGYLVLVSVGTLLAGFSLPGADALAASLYYLIHSTLACAALFLLSGIITPLRAGFGNTLCPGPGFKQPLLLGGLFFLGAVAIAGLPPLSGFVGKALLLKASLEANAWPLWPVLLLASFAVIIALGRAGSFLFWQKLEPALERSADGGQLLAVGVLLGACVLLVVGAEPLLAYLQACALQLNTPAAQMISHGAL